MANTKFAEALQADIDSQTARLRIMTPLVTGPSAKTTGPMVVDKLNLVVVENIVKMMELTATLGALTPETLQANKAAYVDMIADRVSCSLKVYVTCTVAIEFIEVLHAQGIDINVGLLTGLKETAAGMKEFLDHATNVLDHRI